MTTNRSSSHRSELEVPDEDVEVHEFGDGSSSSPLYERYRIKALADQREALQKRTFTKWINSFLIQENYQVNDLYFDLRDGKVLLKLLEILSGEELPQPTRGRMRIHRIENVKKALEFLSKGHKVHIENIGPSDVVDGNPRLTLGLIWTIILRFQIRDIRMELEGTKETKSAEDALLFWCKLATNNYKGVNVQNFGNSWKDGLAFNAILHKYRPDLIQFDKLSNQNPIHNLNNAFDIAEKEFGLSKLLDAEDVYTSNPDEKSIITYLVSYYHYFSKFHIEKVQKSIITKEIQEKKDIACKLNEYGNLTSDILQWIEKRIDEFSHSQTSNQITKLESYRKSGQVLDTHRVTFEHLKEQLCTLEKMEKNSSVPITELNATKSKYNKPDEVETIACDASAIMAVLMQLNEVKTELATFKAKLDVLEQESEKNHKKSSQDSQTMTDFKKVTHVTNMWHRLVELLKEQNAKIKEPDDLRKLLPTLDYFQTPALTDTVDGVFNSLSDSTDANNLHRPLNPIKEHIDSYSEDLNNNNGKVFKNYPHQIDLIIANLF